MTGWNGPAVADTAITRQRVRVRGVVQGVGFRPHIARLARRLGLSGWVCNDSEGVLMEVQGARVSEFLAMIPREAPPLARIDELVAAPIVVSATETGFAIQPSRTGPAGTVIPADVAVCEECLRELFDSSDRRHLYPFLNCTHCGPRYTITHRVPYDRPHTSMSKFKMCAACKHEYMDPDDRRYHAEPVACPQCGPQMSMSAGEIVRRIRAGEIVAVKGLGGFHLACDARSEDAVSRLRARKNREQKPFAVMVRDIETVRTIAECDESAEQILLGAARPIVLLRKRGESLASDIAPQLAWIGVMLPYTPLHHLIFAEDPDAIWVMTSANPGDEPLAIGNEEAARRLAGIADAFAWHDRDIVVRADDSVIRWTGTTSIFVRRARGFVPGSIRLPRSSPPVLAVGAHLKNTVCVTRGNEAFLSQHIGDMDNPATYDFFRETVEHLLGILDVRPDIVAHDLHPDFLSTRFATELGIPAVPVQHHHAHIAHVCAEHGIESPVLGIALDGFGLGPRNESWGGELLKVEGSRYERLGHLAYLQMPGGDVASREPWRMAAAVLDRLGRADEIERRFDGFPEAGIVRRMMAGNVNASSTSSCGRLFDAACGLLGVLPKADYEGQAPMILESLVTRPEVMSGGWSIADGVLDLVALLENLINRDPIEGANLFHGTLIEALAEWAACAAEKSGIRTVALGGGCFVNSFLSDGLVRSLRQRNLCPLVARMSPPSDGGLSLGQAWIAMRAGD